MRNSEIVDSLFHWRLPDTGRIVPAASHLDGMISQGLAFLFAEVRRNSSKSKGSWWFKCLRGNVELFQVLMCGSSIAGNRSDRLQVVRFNCSRCCQRSWCGTTLWTDRSAGRRSNLHCFAPQFDDLSCFPKLSQAKSTKDH